MLAIKKYVACCCELCGLYSVLARGRLDTPSASYVSHVEHSVMPSGQLFSAGQFHNCIFNIKY